MRVVQAETVFDKRGKKPNFVLEHNTNDGWRLRHQPTGRVVPFGFGKQPDNAMLNKAELQLLIGDIEE